MTQSFFWRYAVYALLALFGLTSCASERAPINRVQANALQKSFFVGANLSDPSDNPEFYYRPTIVNVDYGDSRDELFTASGAQTIARVKFEITEDLLIARLTYQLVSGTTSDGTPNPPDENAGQIVAAFKIESHFDIKRSYNPTTGEELNIIEENTTDSPWYERQYMRVDWSQNLIADAYQLDTLAAMTAFDDAFQYEPVAYSVSDPTDPDAPVFDPGTNYFDITNKVFVSPQMLDTPFGQLPACYLSPDFLGGNGPDGNCNPTEVKVRLSFRLVVNDDYEPANWDGIREQMFGMFTTGAINPNRLGYDRNYGVVDDQWYRFVSRHNIWQESHYRDAAGNPMPCYTDQTTPVGALPSRDEAPLDGTDDECETAGAGSRCDQFSHACTLPYAQRKTKTTPFYYGPTSDPTLWDASSQALSQWDHALRHAVQTARYTECIRTGGGVTKDVIANCKTQYDPSETVALAAIPSVFVFCHNPVIQGDDPACGAPGLLARIGDLRYNMIDIIQDPQNASPWGIMADAVDPITGEVVAASVNLWNAVTDLATESAIDTMRWYLGELSNADIANANYTQPLVTANLRAPQATSESPPLLDAAAQSARLSALDSRLNDGTKYQMPSLTIGSQGLADWAESMVRQKYGNQVLGSGNAGIDSRMTSAQNSAVEAQLMTQPYLHLAGLDPSMQPNSVGTNLASPLRGNFAQFLLDFERARQSRLEQMGSCVEEAPEPSSVVDWANIMSKKFPLVDEDPRTPGVQASAAAIAARNDLWRDYIRRHITVGVVEHELGHSMGLEHNFTSSFDATNFRPQYWQLRTQDGAVTTPCAAGTTDGSTCVGPRWEDPITQAERDGLIWRWQQTSVMDYAGDLTQDTLDIGAYDKAAIRMEYADVADVWDDASVSCSGSAGGASCTPNGHTVHSQLDGFGGVGGPIYIDGQSDFHYSQLNQHLGLIRNCAPANTSQPANWDATKDGVYSPEFDGQIVNGTSCDSIPTDYVPYRELQPDTGGFTQEPVVVNGIQRNFDALGRVRRSYMFGDDQFADIGNLAVLRQDNGADAYEVTHFLISRYEDQHIFRDYRRNRTDFSLKKSFMYGFQRENSKLTEITKGFGFLNDLYQGTNLFATFAADDGQLKAGALAASMAFDHFARILTRPQSGAHFNDTALHPLGTNILRSTDQLPNVAMPTGITAQGNVLIPDGSTGVGVDVGWGGRLVNNTLDQSQGYYAVQYDLALGSYYDKTLAVYMMSDSEDRFVSEARDDFTDGRYRNTSFATLFPDGFRRLLANALTEDDDIKGWRVATNKGVPITDATGALAQPMGFRAWWPTGSPDVCWPAQGRLICDEFPSGTVEANATPAESIAVDAEIGFEVQKFIIFFSMLNLPESWKLDWVDMMRIWEIGSDADPGLPAAQTVAWRDPLSGELFEAHSYGTEVIDGKTVQRGIAARVLEWMNTLTAKAYAVDTAASNPTTGELVVQRYADNTACPPGVETCVGQPIQLSSPFAIRVTNYKSVIDYMHLTASQLGFYGPNWRGIY
ncbi:MAG TPA: hypothetical protein VGM44_02205 [Polyangiaceae bacterium]|jgi:hypothetical protein